MNDTEALHTLDNGIAVIHSNQLQQLSDVVQYWLKQYPLAALENEVVLVQSNGMGQWLKQNLADNSALGIAAAISMQLPSMFIWNAYRAVLGEQIPDQQLLAKAPLSWRLYRLLPELIKQPEFATLADFLSDDEDSQKCFQLAEQLADLFDQYQVYRSDWISDWGSGKNVMRNALGEPVDMEQAQVWQAALWRRVLDDLGEQASAFASRAAVHDAFMQHIDSLQQRPDSLPRRIILFGLSSLPQQSLEVFARLGRFCQIVLFVHNPCQHYWADIIEDKELLKAERRRQAYKSGMGPDLNSDELHLHASPLLAAWGKQGRDYIRLLDLFDETAAYASWDWPENKIDLFTAYGEPGQRSLLQHLQQSILDLQALPAEPLILPVADESIAFHLAHSPQREVEILHDQLLRRFAEAEQSAEPLFPRDIIVMVPDINKYAPHILAVFGHMQPDDARYIAFSLADQQQRGQNPVLVALEALLSVPESRFTVSELLALLEVPALRARFAIDERASQKFHQWIEQAGIRWGLDAEHRAQCVAMPGKQESNTWLFGLRRMLLGYAVGAGEAFAGIEPYDEIGGLEAQWLGCLSFLLETLGNYALLLKRDCNSETWQQVLSALLDDFFEFESDADKKIQSRLNTALENWAQSCQLGGLGEADLIPVKVVREAWLEAIDEPSLQQRFLSGRVNFCTLMPMRAIPFRLICLLGMNDGDYPRTQQPQSFDLMSQRGHYRPGDRSRRQDDLYMFLEALLSARQQLYISWVGRSIRDNSERPASVLITQLRQVLEQGWAFADTASLLESITLEHPLQPFSRRYVSKNRDQRLFTYAHEWFAGATSRPMLTQDSQLSEQQDLSLSLPALAAFLKAPVKTYCNQTLKYRFENETLTSEDDEPFGFDNLQSYIYSESLLQALSSAKPEAEALQTFFLQQQNSMQQRGQLPLAGFAELNFAALAIPVQSCWDLYQALKSSWPETGDAQLIKLAPFSLADGTLVELNGALNNIHCNQNSQALIYLSAQNILDSRNQLKYQNVLLHWVQHLAACADQLQPQTYLVTADAIVNIKPIAAQQAYALLETLLQIYYRGLKAPLPMASRTAFVWLSAAPEDALQKAIKRYEGDDWTKGEVDYDPYLTRFFPSFADLDNSPVGSHFEALLRQLYEPLYQHVEVYEMSEEMS